MNPALFIATLATPEGVGGDPILAAFADGTDGFYFDFSKTDRLFQNLTGTPADDAGENIYLGLESSKWQGRTYAQQLAAQTERVTNGGFASDLSGWTLPGTGWAWDAGKATFSGGAGDIGIYQDIGSSAVWYRVDYTLSGYSAGSLSLRIGGGSNLHTASANGSYTLLVLAQGTDTQLKFIPTGTFRGSIDNVSVRPVPGNHGLQATTSAQPKWQTGGLARFDGSDDVLVTTLNPSVTANTLITKLKVGATASRVVMGCQGTTRLYLAVGAGGELAAGVGDQPLTTIVANNGDLRGQTGVAALVADGSTVKLYWNGVEVYSAAQSGAFDPVPAVRIGSNSGSSFTDSDIYHALAIKKALTAAQIAAITNKWGTS